MTKGEKGSRMGDKKNGWYWIPLLGTGLCLIYLAAATTGVVYSDYIRLINSYLPDVWNPEKFFVVDVLVRIPVNYLGRIMNTAFFGYSATFDMVLGVFSLGASGMVLAAYCRRKDIGWFWYLLLMFLLFSLNKWEMLTNGTGWCHFLAFWGFYYHYLVLDRVWENRRRERAGELSAQEKTRDKNDRRRLMVLPWVLTLGAAGPYCGAYSAVLLLTYGAGFFLDWKEEKKADWRYGIYAAHVLVPLLLYLISNSFTVQEYAGTTGRGIGEVLSDNAVLFPKFLVKGFSSMVLGEEAMMTYLAKLNRGMALGYLAGCLVLAGYLLALGMQVYYRIYRTSVLPLMFILWGGMNHFLVLAARWIFENSDYGMSSRYALQYQVGVLGMLLTFALAGKWEKDRKKGQANEKLETQGRRRRQGIRICWLAALGISGVLFLGNLCTTWREVKTAPYRKAYAREVEKMALHYQDVPDDELESRFQYRHGPERIRRALGILEEQGWNVYRNSSARENDFEAK